VSALARQLIALCLLRRAPQDLPYSPALTRHLVLLGFAIDVVYVSLLEVEQPWPRLLFALAMSLGVPWLLLQLRGHGARYAQTLAALAGSGALFTLAFLPVALWTRQFAALGGSGVEPGVEQMAAGWVVLLLLGWRLAVNGHILRHALDLPRWAGALLAIAWFLVEFSLDRRLFGVTE
jgi:hypothetical protein